MDLCPRPRRPLAPLRDPAGVRVASGPRDLRRQRHQDRFDIAAGSETEPRAAVVKQVEFNIAPAANKLVAALFGGPGGVHPGPRDPRIDREKRLAHAPHKGKVAVPVAAVEIVEKDPAGAARFAPMRQVEIIVAPRLEARMALRIVTVAGGLEGGVEVFRGLP